MKLEDGVLKIDMVDLDHILDFDIFDKNTPPSKIFLEGIQIECKMNGIDYGKVKTLKINL